MPWPIRRRNQRRFQILARIRSRLLFQYAKVAVGPGATPLESNSADPRYGTAKAALVAFDEGMDGCANLIEPAKPILLHATGRAIS